MRASARLPREARVLSPTEPASRELSFLETSALILSLFFVGVSFGGSSPLVSAILESRGRSEYFTGGVVAMLSLGLALASPVAGRLVDRFGPRPVNVAGLLLQGAGFAGLGVALETDARLLFGVRLWLGVAAALTFVAAEFALLRGSRPSHRGRVMAAYGAGFGLGFMVGVFVGNRAYDWIGIGAFGLWCGIAALIAPLAYWGMRGMAGLAAGGDAAGNLEGKPSPSSLPLPGLALALYGAVVYAVLDVAMTGTYPVEGQRLGLTRGQALDLVGWMAFGTIVIQPLAGWLSDRFGNRRLLLSLAGLGFGSAVLAGLASVHWLPETTAGPAVAFALVGAAVGGVFPVSLALLGERTPPALLSRANAWFSTVFGWASLIAPLVAALFIDVAERTGLLGWAVPSLAILTFGAALPLGAADRRFLTEAGRFSPDGDVVEKDHSLPGAVKAEANRREAG